MAEQLRQFSSKEEIYNHLINSYYSDENAFEELNKYLDIQMPISEYLTMFRNHFPQIDLSKSCEEILIKLIESNWDVGIISDGRSITQRNKIKALGLQNFVHDDRIVISEEFGSEKPSEANFQYFVNINDDCDVFVYVGDNVKKDFVTPNKLGWYTIGIKDNGSNIHKNATTAQEYQPQLWISEIENLITALESFDLI